MTPYIKPSNLVRLNNFIAGYTDEHTMQGAQLQALCRLINSKGQRVITSEDSALLGLKCIEYTAGRFLPLKWNGIFPAVIKVHVLQANQL